MDVYRATCDYVPPQGCVGVIPLGEGDFFEVLESEDYRYHKDWWGVRADRGQCHRVCPS